MQLDTLTKPEWDLEHYQDGNVEHDLFESVVTEYNDIQGSSINYFIRDKSIEMDTLYGESTNTGYIGPYKTKMTYSVTEEATMTDPFGITSVDVIQYGFMPKATFTRDVSGGIDPMPGDVIQTLWNELSYEVVDVGEEMSIFQTKKMVWEFILKPFRFSDQSESAREVSFDIDSTLSEPLTAYGDNQWIESESDDVDVYSDVDTSIYGF
jgi:hypothetical protein